ncbi:MAG: DUF3048 domain-containing protein [Anaerolineae bacterium]|nr:DUF3048 domain-containing protein [Anaerolineae bacterium]
MAPVLLSIGALVVVLLVSLAAGLTPLSAAGQGNQPTIPPTNTHRPTMPPTNTPRITPTMPPTATPRPSDTPSITPTFTPTSSPTPSRTPTATPSPTATTVGPSEYPEGFNPLTGLPFPSEEAANRRTLIVKVSNFPEIVRPQSGLDKADIVFEYEVEGGVTRFAAIYRSQGTDHVGSVRSARLLDLELVEMFEGLLAYSGSNEWIRQYILDSEWKWRALSPHIGVNEPFERFPEDGKAYEHTLFGDTYKMWEIAEQRNVNDAWGMRGFAFTDAPDPDGEPVQDIFIDYYNDRQDTRWQYNPDDGRYYRWNSGLPHVDAITGEQLAADNIVVLEAEHVNRPDIYESETGGTVIETILWGHGPAWLFRDGMWYEGEWWHAQGKLGLWLLYPGGEDPMHLKPGQTWFEIVRPFMWGVDLSENKVDMQATSSAIYGTQTQIAAGTATAAAPYITPTLTPTIVELP